MALEERPLPTARPVPPRRHAAPMGPWPWVRRPDGQTSPEGQRALQWDGYPQSHFPNWTPAQIRASGIAKAIEVHSGTSMIHVIDITKNGEFTTYDPKEITKEDKPTDEWHTLRPADVSLRIIFAENLGGKALQILGSRYNIEPFFFSSSLNWIPSRYAEDIRPKEGDHITITLTFLRVEKFKAGTAIISKARTTLSGTEVVDTQAPLVLHSPKDHSRPDVTSPKVFFLDLLAIHVARDRNSSTIISYHPAEADCTTSAKELHARIKLAGDSVYWQKIFRKGQNASDPAFVLLAILWHALYAWDEALEVLYTHFCWLESQVLVSTDLKRTEEVHIIREHLLHHATLLQDFQKSVEFVMKTPNPAMDALDEDERIKSREQLRVQCKNLLSEISRLESWRDMMDKRVKNVMDLSFSLTNIRDSNAMKQLSYLAILFVPPTFVADLFGMNLYELNGGKGTIVTYIATAIAFTVVSVWIMVAYRVASAVLHWYGQARQRRRWSARQASFSRSTAGDPEVPPGTNAYPMRGNFTRHPRH